MFSGAPYDISIPHNPRLQTVNLPISQIRLPYNSSCTGGLSVVDIGPGIAVNLSNLAPVTGSIFVGNIALLSIPSLA
jgi:hypothetical protein